MSTASDPIDLPAFTQDARILFQGDSITDGHRSRDTNPSHILGHSYAFLIAAKYGAALADRRLTFLNRGISGNTVLDLHGRWQKDTLDLEPDFLSVLIGINDLARGVPLRLYEETYDQLLATTRAAFPQLRLVLGEPFLLPAGQVKEAWDLWQDGLHERQAIVARLAAKYGAALVHYQRAFDAAAQRASAEYWIWDGVHPTAAGHQIMAEEWERTVRAFWPAATA